MHPWQSGEPPVRPPRHDVAVVIVVDDFMSASMRSRTIENKRKYADHWGYALVAPSVSEVHAAAGGFPTAWAKLSVARTALQTHAYVFVVDGDAVIMRADIDLGLAIEGMEEAGASLLIAKDFNGLNSGVFMLKNDSWTHAFLAEAMAARAVLARTTRTIPLKYENRAFFYLTGMWPECFGMRRLDSLLAPEYKDTRKFREGVQVVDRCLINRRPRHSTQIWHLMASDSGFDDLTSSFVVHVPGGNAASKHTVVSELLSQSQLGESMANGGLYALL